MRFLLTRPEANESRLSASEVIKAMKGPLEPAADKGAIAQLLRPKLRNEELDTQAELFRVQAAHALLDTCFDQEWKNEA
ncbi:MAG: hypothetical protein JWP58_3801 [Hymenobacter sp.]|nr:hypothetical protein [Hymenobacter sp.]